MITFMEVAGRTGAYGVCLQRLHSSFVLKSWRKYQKSFFILSLYQVISN